MQANVYSLEAKMIYFPKRLRVGSRHNKDNLESCRCKGYSTLLKNTSATGLLNKRLKKNGIGETEELLVAQYK